jgi:DNA-binding NarL/FixJ family response regulator
LRPIATNGRGPTLFYVSNNHLVRRPNPGQPLAVLLRSGDPLVRDGLEKGLLASGAKLALTGREDDAHVVLLDPGPTPDVRRLESDLSDLATKRLAVVVLVTDEPAGRSAIASGARGVVRRGADGARLAAALGAAAAGLTVVDFALVPDPAPGEPAPSLTPREREVLGLIAAGCSNRRIAKKLGISEHTAKFHVNGILLKLGANTRTEAVVLAARRGLLMI